jgi:hypothetical protein
MHRVRIGKNQRTLPGSWDEMDSNGLAFALTTLIRYPDRDKAMLQILKKLLHINKVTFLAIPDDAMYDLVRLFDWMDLSKLTIPIYQRIMHKGISFELPGKDFDFGTAFQYAAADEYFLKFHESGDQKDLDLMLTVLLSREKPINSLREVQENAEFFSDLPEIFRVSVLVYFNACKLIIYDTYKNWLFIDPETGEGDGMQLGVDFGWWGRYLEIAKSGVFGRLDQVYATRFHDIAMFLVQEKEIYLAEKRALKSNQK